MRLGREPVCEVGAVMGPRIDGDGVLWLGTHAGGVGPVPHCA